MEGLLLHREGRVFYYIRLERKGRGWVTTFGFRRMRKLLRASVFSPSCEVGVSHTEVGEVPGAQVSLVTAAVAALSQEPKESGEGWACLGEQETLTGGIRGDSCQFQGPI